MRVLVTGGAGYVGSHVVRTLLEAGHEPIVYDNLSTGHADAVRNAELIEGDLADQEHLLKVVTSHTFDGCIHLAALSLVGESVQAPARYFRNNILGGLNLADALVAGEIPWVVFSSTAAVYGDPETVPITEFHAAKPSNPYGDSKATLEKVLQRYDQAYGLRYTALRYFNAAGAHPSGDIGEDHSPESHLIPLVIKAAMGSLDGVDIFGADYPTPDGTAVRDFVHVCDLADAHLGAMNWLRSGGVSGVFNLGSGHGYSVLEVVNAVATITGRPVRTRCVARRPGDPAVLVASAARALDVLGWKPRHDLDSIVGTAWKWHQSHPEGFGRS